MIVGTAGHIDHGKTALVRALTGVDTDRLPEEKKRGITIELGFAPLVLDGVGTVGVVDVPGHEAFVHTMLAGAGGIDVGLLVIAANDGVQPQTREHLTILKLLGVRAGVVALTKCDLAEPAWIDMVEDDVRALVADSPFAGAPIVRVSPGDAAALDAVRDALAAALRTAPPRAADELFRLPVDRVFTVRGTGTVVTGTSWSGTIRANDEVRVLPSDRRTRVRGVQIHNAETDAAAPGSRTAVALADLSTDDVHRGDVLVTDERWIPTLILRADLQLLPDAPRALGPRTKVRFHLGTADVGARAIAVGGALQPGEVRPVRLVLDAPVVARAGDRFVLRAPSPAATIGGGVITDAMAARRSKPFARVGMSASERLTQMLREAGARGVSIASLGVRLVSRLAEVASAVRESGARVVDDMALELAALATAHARLIEILGQYHADHPLAAAAPLSEIREQLRVGTGLADLVVAEAQRSGVIAVEAAGVRRAGWEPNLADRDSAQLAALVQRLEDAGGEPPTVAELGQEFGKSVPALLHLAESQKSVVQVEVNRYYTTANINRIIGAIEARFPVGSLVTPSEIRELLGTSRKYVIPLLEYFDRMGITSRKESGRLWRGRP